MKHIAVLLTVHNRKEKTLLCLKNLYAQSIPHGYAMDVYLTDDGCIDGTPEAIRKEYPQVHIVKGDGNLFWNRGMYRAWEAAAKSFDYDYYLWLNDDSYLFEDAIEILLNSSLLYENQAIIVASMRSADKEIVTYGGYTKDGLLFPNGALQECDTFHGNCVLIPRRVFEKVGNLDWKFRHAIGDLDYGYRTRKAGFKLYVAPKFLGICENNSQLPPWARKEVPFKKRVKNLYSPLGYAEPIPFFYYERRNFGLMIALKHFITIHIRVLFPQLWKK